MSDERNDDAVKSELKRLTDAFFRSVSFEPGEAPSYGSIYELFIEDGLLIRNTSATPEICRIRQFIEPRQAMVNSGELMRFHEAEFSDSTEVFGNVAHRFSAYAKSGTLKGVPFEARGLTSIQFIRTSSGWRISSMTWDDERPGLELPKKYEA